MDKLIVTPMERLGVLHQYASDRFIYWYTDWLIERLTDGYVDGFTSENVDAVI